ncbi:MAG: hexitol phosphatase HxpB [Bacteroidales bacterium]
MKDKSYLEAIIFDMDGVIINSEPLWKIAEKKIFSKLGVPVSEKEINESSALTVVELCEMFYEKFPWGEKNFKKIEELIVAEVFQLIKTNDTEIPGVKNVLKFLRKKEFKLALASNSSHDLIEVVLNKVGVKEYFDFVASAEDVTKGKPDPEIYNYTAKSLGVVPEKCLVIEDSIVGVKSAKNAGMIVISMPSSEDFDKKEFELADLKISSLYQLPYVMKVLRVKEG